MFGKTFNIISVAGFKIGIDISWFFIAILLTWTLAIGYFPFYYPHLTEGSYWLMGFFGMLGLFISVTLHELGHAIVARHYGLIIQQITLFIFGGVAHMKREPTSPKAEFFIAIAGPIVSIIIAICMYLLWVIGQKNDWPLQILGILNYLALINTVIVIFNLVPAFPLDGGRVLRAILWWWKNNLALATSISAKMGSGFGFGLIFLGLLSFITGNLFSGLWWMILGLFLHQAASASQTQFYVKQGLEGEPVAKFMKTPISVPPDLTIKEFVDQYVYQSYHHLYPVAENDILLGYISLKEIKSISHDEWNKILVKNIMVPSKQFRTISPQESAMEALNVLQESDMYTLLVVKDNHLLGILTTQDLFKLISVKIELQGGDK